MPSNFDAGEVSAAVTRVEAALKPDVVRIRWDYGEDWAGRDALFFRVVISEDAAAHRLREVLPPLWRSLGGHALGTGRFGYVNVRSESECRQLNDPEWMAA